jgi:hypothetical protein
MCVDERPILTRELVSCFYLTDLDNRVFYNVLIPAGYPFSRCAARLTQFERVSHTQVSQQPLNLKHTFTSVFKDGFYSIISSNRSYRDAR